MINDVDMLDFIYDSLDTVKKLKFPSWKQVAQMTVGIFVAVVIAGVYFVGVDTLFSDGYSALYSAMTGKEIVSTQQDSSAQEALTAAEVESMLSGVSLQVQSGVQVEAAQPTTSGTGA